MAKLILEFADIEIAALCVASREARNVFYAVPDTEKRVIRVLDKIEQAVSAQAPEYLPMLRAER